MEFTFTKVGINTAIVYSDVPSLTKYVAVSKMRYSFD